MSVVDPQGSEDYWIDGGAFSGVLPNSVSVDSEAYWIDGGSVPWFTEAAAVATDTSKFFFLLMMR